MRLHRKLEFKQEVTWRPLKLQAGRMPSCRLQGGHIYSRLQASHTTSCRLEGHMISRTLQAGHMTSCRLLAGHMISCRLQAGQVTSCKLQGHMTCRLQAGHMISCRLQGHMTSCKLQDHMTSCWLPAGGMASSKTNRKHVVKDPMTCSVSRVGLIKNMFNITQHPHLAESRRLVNERLGNWFPK